MHRYVRDSLVAFLLFAFLPHAQCLAQPSDERMTLPKSRTDVRCVAFSPDSKILVSAGTQGNPNIDLWEVSSGKKVAMIQTPFKTLWFVVFSPDGKSLAAAGSYDKDIHLWDMTTYKRIATFSGHTQGVCSVCFSPDGKLLASAGRDQTIRLWDVATEKNIATLQKPESYFDAVIFSPDGKTLASGGSRVDMKKMKLTGEVKLWDVKSGKITAELEGHLLDVRSVAFSPDGKLLVSGGSGDRTFRFWDVKTGKNTATIREDGLDRATCLAFTPDGKTLVLAGYIYSGNIRLCDVETRKLSKPFKGHFHSINSVAVSADGKTIATGDTNGTIKLWDVPNAP